MFRSLQSIEHAVAMRVLHAQSVADIRRRVEVATIEAAREARDFEVLLHHPDDEAFHGAEVA